MVSLRRLSDKTVTRYLTLEKEGKLTPRQQRALQSHRQMVAFSSAMDKGSEAGLRGEELIDTALRQVVSTQFDPKEELRLENRKKMVDIWYRLSAGLTETEFPDSDLVEAFAIVTEVLRKPENGFDPLPNDAGRRVIFEDMEGIISCQLTTEKGRSEFNVFADSQEYLRTKNDGPIQYRHLKFLD